MSLSDSDSDDFFSDIRAFRQRLGLAKAPAAPNKGPDTSTDGSHTPAGSRSKRSAAPQHSATRPRKRRSIGDVHVEKNISAGVTTTLGVVSAGEIAALLSPRGARQRRKKKQPADLDSSQTSGSEGGSRRGLALSPMAGIPVRTPESRIASPHALLQRPRTFSGTPTALPRPTSSQRLSRAGTNAESPDMASFDMRSMWENTEFSPTTTPIRRLRPASPLLRSAKQAAASVAMNAPFGVSSMYSGPAQSHGGLLGKVEEAMVTDEDLDAARRKLGQEQALTQQQIMREIRERLLGFASQQSSEPVIGQWQSSAILLCQFYTFGCGMLAYTKQGILWRGDFLGPIANVAQSIGAEESAFTTQLTTNTTLLFPWLNLSNLRVKDIDGCDFVMATVDSDMGIAFQPSIPDEAAESVADLVDRMNDQLQRVLADHRMRQVDRHHMYGDAAASNEIVDVARKLLRLAASDQDEQLATLDIEQALCSTEFMDHAASSILELSQQLAKDAQAALNGQVSEPATTDNAANRHTNPDPMPNTCTLCYAEDESIELEPCSHRMCGDCFSHLQRIYPSSSQAEENDPSVTCSCPWDRCPVSSWTELK